MTEILLTDDLDQMLPPSGRRRTLLRAIRAVDRSRNEAPLIVEVGTIRDPRPLAQLADGWATLVFGWYASVTGGLVISIDTNREAIATARRVTEDFWPWIRFVHATDEFDTTEVLSRIDAQIDLLYLDGPCNGETASNLHYTWFESVKRPPAVIVVDDAGAPDFGVKGRVVVPAAIEAGYEMLFHDNDQVGLRRRDNEDTCRCECA